MERPFWIVFIESSIAYNLSILLYIIELSILKMSNIGLPPLCSEICEMKYVKCVKLSDSYYCNHCNEIAPIH